MINDDEKKVANDLLPLIDSIIYILDSKGEDTIKGYSYLRKIRNILISRDPNGLKKIRRHLFMDFRTIRDSQLDTDELDEKMNEAYRLAISNSIFNEDGVHRDTHP